MQVRRTSGFEFGVISHLSLRNHIVPTEVARASNRQKYDGGIFMCILSMAKDGQFSEEWCAENGITERTLYACANEHPEVAEVVEAAWHLLHAYWARLLRETLKNPARRQTTILHVMAKRFPETRGLAPSNTLEHFLASGETNSSPFPGWRSAVFNPAPLRTLLNASISRTFLLRAEMIKPPWARPRREGSEP